MEIKHGKGKTKYGTGIEIKLNADEIAKAIYTYLIAHDIHVSGAATITSENGKLLTEHSIYVDPSGQVVAKGKLFSGRGKDID